MLNSNVYEDVYIRNRLISTNTQLDYLRVKVLEIFDYDGWDLTVPKEVLEKLLTQSGSGVIYEYEDSLFVSDATPTGDPDIYGRDTAVSIDHGGEILERTIGIDAVLMKNDSASIGLEPLLTELALLTAQAKITVLDNFMNLRVNRIIQAKDANAFKSALEYEEAVRDGAPAIIMAEEFDAMEGINVHPTPVPTNAATQTIELFQYVSSYYYSELGININNNMKRQYVNEEELEQSTGLSLITNMLTCREEAIADINALFDRDISIRVSEIWDDEMEKTGLVEESESSEEEPYENSEDIIQEAEVIEAIEPEEAPEERTKEEVIEATEEMSDEEVETDTTTDDASDKADSGEDEEERTDVETEEENDEE